MSPSFGSIAGACQIVAPPRRYSPFGHVLAPGSPGPAVVYQRQPCLPLAASSCCMNERVPYSAPTSPRWIFPSTLPVLWSSATTVPSSCPTYTRPSPSATPRLSQPQQTVVIAGLIPDLYSQRILPVATLTANVSSSPVVW